MNFKLSVIDYDAFCTDFTGMVLVRYPIDSLQWLIFPEKRVIVNCSVGAFLHRLSSKSEKQY